MYYLHLHHHEKSLNEADKYIFSVDKRIWRNKDTYEAKTIFIKKSKNWNRTGIGNI